jgi:hypothetical protein
LRSQTGAFNVILHSGQDVKTAKGKVGNQDVIDLVTDSITRFAKNGRVSTKGSFGQLVNSAG